MCPQQVNKRVGRAPLASSGAHCYPKTTEFSNIHSSNLEPCPLVSERGSGSEDRLPQGCSRAPPKVLCAKVSLDLRHPIRPKLGGLVDPPPEDSG